MWRAFFLAVGAMLFIVGIETLLIDSATIYSASESSATDMLDPSARPASKTKVVKPGDPLRVVVHHLDPRSRRIALHPALPPERAEEPRQRVGKNASLQVAVVKAAPPGLQVRVLGATGRHARGFIPAGQTGTPRGTDLAKHFKLGAQLEAKVIDFDPKRGEPKLSITRLAQDEERRATKEYRQKLKAEAHFGTLGDLLKSKLGGG